MQKTMNLFSNHAKGYEFIFKSILVVIFYIKLAVKINNHLNIDVDKGSDST